MMTPSITVMWAADAVFQRVSIKPEVATIHYLTEPGNPGAGRFITVNPKGGVFANAKGPSRQDGRTVPGKKDRPPAPNPDPPYLPKPM